MLQRVVAGTGVAVVVLAAALWPAGTTSAAIGKTTTCQAYQADEAKQEKADTKLTKLLESGKWAASKKALVSTAGQEASEEKEFASVYLKGAPQSVRAAAAVALKLDATFKTVIEKAKNLSQYEKGITAAETTPKVQAAFGVLDAYTTQLCGNSTTTTSG